MGTARLRAITGELVEIRFATYWSGTPGEGPLSDDFGILIWAFRSFWCKRRGSLLIGASQLLITVLALRLDSIQPRLLFSTSRISLFHTWPSSMFSGD
jgi:hypothetical protein